MHPAFLYLPGERLTETELSACRLDGLVVELGEGYIPADLVETAHARAAAVAPLLSADLAAAGPTAAWIHGAGDTPPAPHHARRAVARRIRVRANARLVFHDAVVPAPGLSLIGGIPVTAPVQTMIDLTLGVHRNHDWRRWLQLFVQDYPKLISPAQHALESMTRVPGSRIGRAFLEEIATTM